MCDGVSHRQRGRRRKGFGDDAREKGETKNSDPVMYGRTKALGRPDSNRLRFQTEFGQQYERCATMRPRFLLGALAIVVVGLCGVASADMVVYDNFDSATWTRPCGRLPARSVSLART